MSDIITTLSNTKCFSPNIQIRKRMMVCLTIIVDPWHNPPSHEGSSQEQCRWKKEMISNNMAKPFILSTILTHLSIANVWNVAVIGTQIDKRWWYQFPLLKWRCLKSKNIDDINIHSWDGRVNPHVDKYWWFDIYFWDGGWQILMIY